MDYGYYNPHHFEKFRNQLKADLRIIQAAVSEHLWDNMGEQEGKLFFQFTPTSHHLTSLLAFHQISHLEIISQPLEIQFQNQGLNQKYVFSGLN
jgi:hypothetical protein